MPLSQNKVPRLYKLSKLCRGQMKWIRKRLALSSDTSVVEFSVNDLCHRLKIDDEGYLVPQDGGFALFIGMTQVATVSSKLVADLPPEYLARPMGQRGALLSMLLLVVAKGSKGTMVINQDALASLRREPPLAPTSR
jgi:hypothetical protein